MCDLTFVARQTDGLILAETWDASSEEAMQRHKVQAKQLLKRLHNAPPQCSIDSEAFSFHYTIADGVIFMTLCERGYPKKLAFAFLDDLTRAFREELQREFGTAGGVDYRSKVETIEKPYYFIKFDRVIQKKRSEYRDPTSQRSMQRVQESLLEVNAIVKKSIDEILLRGENLEDVGRRATALKDSSKDFVGMAKKMNWQLLLQKYGLVAALASLVFIVLFLKLRGC